MTTLVTAPDLYSFVQDSIYITLETDAIDTAKGKIVITLNGGPTTGQEITLTWLGGNTATFIAGPAVTDDGLTWPNKSAGESNADYAGRIRNFLLEYEPISDAFLITVAANIVTLEARNAGLFACAVDNTLSNVVAVATPVTVVTTPDNLSALVAVEDAAGELLMKIHGTYGHANHQVSLNLSPAMTPIELQLPPVASMANTPLVQSTGTAPKHMLEYRFRYGSKQGTPPIAGRMVATEGTYYAIYGGTTLNALEVQPGNMLRHSYYRESGEAFVKPISPEQPDWIYWLAREDGLDGPTYNVRVRLTWSDGNQSLRYPFGTGDRAYTPGVIHWVKSGYYNLGLAGATPPAGSDPAALIVSYDVELFQDGGTGEPFVKVTYLVEHLATPGTMFLLMDNGIGGLETVWLAGAKTTAYEVTREQYRRARYKGIAADVADIDTLFSEGRETIKVTTGYYEDPYYLNHLKQLLHGATWLVDTKNKRFLRVIIENTTLESINEESSIHALALTIRSAWINTVFNV